MYRSAPTKMGKKKKATSLMNMDVNSADVNSAKGFMKRGNALDTFVRPQRQTCVDTECKHNII